MKLYLLYALLNLDLRELFALNRQIVPCDPEHAVERTACHVQTYGRFLASALHDLKLGKPVYVPIEERVLQDRAFEGFLVLACEQRLQLAVDQHRLAVDRDEVAVDLIDDSRPFFILEDLDQESRDILPFHIAPRVQRFFIGHHETHALRDVECILRPLAYLAVCRRTGRLVLALGADAAHGAHEHRRKLFIGDRIIRTKSISSVSAHQPCFAHGFDIRGCP